MRARGENWIRLLFIVKATVRVDGGGGGNSITADHRFNLLGTAGKNCSIFNYVRFGSIAECAHQMRYWWKHDKQGSAHLNLDSGFACFWQLSSGGRFVARVANQHEKRSGLSAPDNMRLLCAQSALIVQANEFGKTVEWSPDVSGGRRMCFGSWLASPTITDSESLWSIFSSP